MLITQEYLSENVEILVDQDIQNFRNLLGELPYIPTKGYFAIM